ncbi:pyridoxamine 5'-phosphate oxidase family protein [Frankia sp. QA3]|uniref:pyridoxamine 5'-phosphate oxidase family protein n=1 Tax=Frankia sp. QA3 TaxID=710111 RepID=UPI0002F82A51|nr:pyridoxamine 5'-phosphate oxidase family protein [Frankia sp. QA3]
MPGIGETPRLTGAARRNGARVTIDIEEAFVHCAKCMRRSGLWKESGSDGRPQEPGAEHADHPGDRPHHLADPEVAAFLRSAPFAVPSSWDSDGDGDTSPRGDRPGFVHILDEATLAIPDRTGNQRTDTFHNLLTCDEISLAAAVPGCDEVLHLSGHAYATDGSALLAPHNTSPATRRTAPRRR